MIYTIGHTWSYLNAFQELGSVMKRGRTNDYQGGSVWQTQEEAAEYAKDGYSVFGVKADWEKDTVPNIESNWHDLLIDAELVILE